MPGVLIAGAGPAGLAAAVALAERAVPVTVVDPSGGATAQRAELLPQGAASLMARLGLEGALRAAIPIAEVVSAWGAATQQAHGAHPGLGHHGWGIDRDALATAMVARVRALGVPILPHRVTSVARDRGGWRVDLSGGLSRTAQYLIDATGRPAHIARRQGAVLLTDGDLTAVTWQAPPSERARMLAEATPHGWWYEVPHRTGRTIGLVTTAHQAKRPPRDLLREAAPCLRLMSLSDVAPDTRRMDSRSSALSQRAGPGWLATGDAAASFDPITSQGVFNALSGGFFAGHAAADALEGDADAPFVYAALAARTAERTHTMTRLQYAAMPFDTAFWQDRATGASSGPRAA